MLPRAETFQELSEQFRWEIPEHYNIGVDVCDRWAERDPARLAIVYVRPDDRVEEVTFGALRDRSNRLANLLAASGVERGDRVGVLLPQMPEAALAHIAAHKLGAVSIPLFMLFGEEALAFRLSDAGAKAVITNREGAEKLARLRARLPDLKEIFVAEGTVDGCRDLASEMAGQSSAFQPVVTTAEDPAILIYTSGTTGQPKGALHAHRVLLGHLPGVEMSQDLFPQPGDKIWTPADWAWIGGLLDVLLPALHHGVPVVACRFAKFSAEAAFALIESQGIRNAFIPPTALKMMRGVEAPERRWRMNLRSIGSGGETLGSELIEWGRRVFGVTINEFYGQTECNVIVSSCSVLMPARPGIMGPAVPGHELAVVDVEGQPLPDGTMGNIAVKAPDPVMFLGYWNNSEATKAKFANDWLLTGDTGVRDEAGWFRFVGRDDDVITSSGYRIGPGEIEDCLIAHPAVKMAGVVGKPDPLRTEIVKAYVVPADGVEPGEALAAEVQSWVKTRLAAYEYPREVSFLEGLPLTTTGKIIRRVLRQQACEEAAEVAPVEEPKT